MDQEKYLEMLIRRGREARPKMLDKVHCHYERESSRIPEQIRVCFEDGTTEIYDLRVVQPPPIIEENIQIIRRMKQTYINQPRRRRNRR